MKYSAYLANGLAILSTDLRCVAENVRHDGVGQAMPIKELALELLRWATRPALWSEARTRARAQSAALRSGHEMRGWITELAGER
jgi:UDP:flavonoid glycosyltransferase YjiC (YdhE family)